MRADRPQHGFKGVNNGLGARLSGGWLWRGKHRGKRKAHGKLAPGRQIG
jgi:hypothetical protein